MSHTLAPRVHRKPLSRHEHEIIADACYAAIERAICPRPVTQVIRVNKVA